MSFPFAALVVPSTQGWFTVMRMLRSQVVVAHPGLMSNPSVYGGSESLIVWLPKPLPVAVLSSTVLPCEASRAMPCAGLSSNTLWTTVVRVGQPMSG